MKRLLNFIKNVTRDYITGGKRSSGWSKLEKEFIKLYPACAACGTKKSLQVHHILPFHIYPELELDKGNLITLCRGSKDCHLNVGHGNNFRAWNPNVKEDSKNLLQNPSKRAVLLERIKLNRKQL